MSLIGLVVTILVIAVILYLITLLPIDPRIKTIAQALVILVAIVWLLQAVMPGIWLGTGRIN